MMTEETSLCGKEICLELSPGPIFCKTKDIGFQFTFQKNILVKASFVMHGYCAIGAFTLMNKELERCILG